MLHAPWNKLASGDPTAWEAFVHQYLPVIQSAVARTLSRGAGHSEDVADVIQEVFLRLCRNEFRLLRRYDPARASENAWLALVARGIAIEHLRHRRPSEISMEDLADIPAPIPSVRDAIELPPSLLTGRQVLVLRLLFDQDLTVEEAAQSLGVSPQTIRSTKHSALTVLRRQFGVQENAEH